MSKILFGWIGRTKWISTLFVQSQEEQNSFIFFYFNNNNKKKASAAQGPEDPERAR